MADRQLSRRSSKTSKAEWGFGSFAAVRWDRALSDRRSFLRQSLLPHQPFWPGKSEILESAVENARFVVTSIASASAVPSSLDRRHNCNPPIATVCWGFDEMRIQAALSAVGASRSIFAAMMKSFSWRPLIFLVRSDTVP